MKLKRVLILPISMEVAAANFIGELRRASGTGLK
jgi:hypothetical protein